MLAASCIGKSTCSRKPTLSGLRSGVTDAALRLHLLLPASLPGPCAISHFRLAIWGDSISFPLYLRSLNQSQEGQSWDGELGPPRASLIGQATQGVPSCSFVSSQPGLHLGLPVEILQPSGGHCIGICGSVPDTSLGKQRCGLLLTSGKEEVGQGVQRLLVV